MAADRGALNVLLVGCGQTGNPGSGFKRVRHRLRLQNHQALEGAVSRSLCHAHAELAVIEVNRLVRVGLGYNLCDPVAGLTNLPDADFLDISS